MTPIITYDSNTHVLKIDLGGGTSITEDLSDVQGLIDFLKTNTVVGIVLHEVSV